MKPVNDGGEIDCFRAFRGVSEDKFRFFSLRLVSQAGYVKQMLKGGERLIWLCDKRCIAHVGWELMQVIKCH